MLLKLATSPTPLYPEGVQTGILVRGVGWVADGVLSEALNCSLSDSRVKMPVSGEVCAQEEKRRENVIRTQRKTIKNRSSGSS